MQDVSSFNKISGIVFIYSKLSIFKTFHRNSILTRKETIIDKKKLLESIIVWNLLECNLKVTSIHSFEMNEIKLIIYIYLHKPSLYDEKKEFGNYLSDIYLLFVTFPPYYKQCLFMYHFCVKMERNALKGLNHCVQWDVFRTVSKWKITWKMYNLFYDLWSCFTWVIKT